jgi:hypothetical protein
VSSRSIVLGLTLVATSAPVAAAKPQPVRTPEDAIAAVKRVLKKNTKKCKLDWARVDAEGYAGKWDVDVTIRASRAGNGIAHWKIGYGYPIATNKLAKSLAKGCGR